MHRRSGESHKARQERRNTRDGAVLVAAMLGAGLAVWTIGIAAGVLVVIAWLLVVAVLANGS